MHRILDYPYPWPKESYTLFDGAVRGFDVSHRVGRIPVLASGSNRSPFQLRRKFPKSTMIPVESIKLIGVDVVFGARISGYGAVPATLFPVNGVVSEVALNWLTPTEMSIMDRSEGLGRGYKKMRLMSSSIVAKRELKVDWVPAYVTEAGALPIEHGLLSLAEVLATGRKFTSGSSEDALDLIRCQFSPGHTLGRFVNLLESDEAFRGEVRAFLFDIGMQPSEPW